MLEYRDCQNVKVERSAKAVVELDCISPSWSKVPKREKASTSGQRSAAAYGANSAP